MENLQIVASCKKNEDAQYVEQWTGVIMLYQTLLLYVKFMNHSDFDGMIPIDFHASTSYFGLYFTCFPATVEREFSAVKIVKIPELNWRLPTGVAMLSQTQFRLPWERVKYFHANKESNDDYKSFLYEVEDVMTSSMLDVVLQEVLSQNRGIMKWHARQEATQLQNYYFGVYLESCDFIKYDSNPNQVLEDDRLDRQSFPALSQKDMMQLIGFDSDLSGIFNRIECEEKWPEVSDKMLKVTLAEHVKLLCQLTNHNKATGGPMLDSKVPELFSTDLEEAIDGKYQAAILAFNKKDSQRRLKDYHDHERFKHLVTKLAIRSRASGIGLLPKLFGIDLERPIIAVNNLFYVSVLL
ncbi:hypothetical protein RHMOL_Rhmol10G0014100 [Rhododendron molle]|uniref:Uncharacterized protein n=1 Tax=Rhododendron molle TaxID=49168 RepID=A0ACC0LXS6_RHOML|nr:hypothetical protein RHMOL_Rhmol10G0014100 [Rhododendron molle]